MERHMKLRDLLYSQVLEEGGPMHRGHMGEVKGAGLAREMGNWERLRTQGQVPLLWVEMEHTDRKA